MARTVNEIQNAILADMSNRTELGVLNSTSQTSIYRLWSYITAIAIYLLEVLFDAHKKDMFYQISQNKVHSGKWYQNISLLFQYDENLQQELIVTYDFIPRYRNIDETKRIISRAAVREGSRKVYIKVNKGVVPNLQVLSPSELSSFSSYINLMKDAGTQIFVQSFPSEKLIAKLEVDYTPSVGIVLAEQVKDMIDDYLANLDYDGTLNVQLLEAKVLADPRVKNIKTTYLLATQNDDTPLFEIYNLPMGINEKVYSTVAGHIVLNREQSQIQLNAV